MRLVVLVVVAEGELQQASHLQRPHCLCACHECPDQYALFVSVSVVFNRSLSFSSHEVFILPGVSYCLGAWLELSLTFFPLRKLEFGSQVEGS